MPNPFPLGINSYYVWTKNMVYIRFLVSPTEFILRLKHSFAPYDRDRSA